MIEYNKEINLKGTGLWFDSKKKAGLSFISNANIDKFTPSEKIIATPETIKFLDKKIKKSVVLACPFYRPFALGNLQVELVPSGHMLGYSQIIVDKDYKTLIYTGDINLNNTKTRDNEVDGTRGSWTIQEGSKDLFLLNRLNGKKYKFNLTEV